MKKLILIAIVIFQFYFSFSQGWFNYGPAYIDANSICFGPYYFDCEMICASNGFYLFITGNYEWEFYTVDSLPVYEGAFTDPETLVIITGNGFSSDGIYSFDIETQQFTLLVNCLSPKFIRYDDFGGKYYVGYENGLLVSDDGTSWEEISFFAGKPCDEMVFHGGNVIVHAYMIAPSLYWSDDSGLTWNTCSTYYQFSRLAFYGEDLFGVIPDNSYSSGLFKSTDLGNTWEVEFWSMYMSDVCYDDYDGELFVSWNNPDYGYQGIAMYEPGLSNAGLTFFNEDLPNTHINRIKYKPVIDAFYAFVCTDTGVYSYLFVGVTENSVNHDILISPNPVTDEMLIRLNLAESNINKIEVLNNLGIKVDEIKLNNSPLKDLEVNWNKGCLPAGIYYLVLRTKNETLTEKFIIL
jgi:hypothetical protein